MSLVAGGQELRLKTVAAAKPNPRPRRLHLDFERVYFVLSCARLQASRVQG